MSGPDPQAEWSAFISRFFFDPNELPAAGDEAVESNIAQARTAWLADPPAPFFLPACVSGWTYWYAACPGQEQRRWVQDLVQAAIGSWIDGPAAPAASGNPLDEAIRILAGSGGYAFRVRLPRNAGSEAAARECLGRLARSLAARPHRRIRLAEPLGRLIGNLADACADRAEARAQDALAIIEDDHRLARPNKLFLRLQYLAAFERWELFQEMEELPDLVRLDRSVMASDAIARFAIARLAPDASPQDFASATAEFGSLIGSVTKIRSAAGAQYYAYWSLASGEPGPAVAVRLAEAGWLGQAAERGGLAALLSAQASSGEPGQRAASLTDVQQALDSGRLDAAIAVLQSLPPSVDQLPVLVDLVTSTLSVQSIRVLEEWRGVLGEPAIANVLAARPGDQQREIAFAAQPFGDALEGAFADDLSAAERARRLADLRAASVTHLMQPGLLQEAVEVVRALGESVSAALRAGLIDLLLDMERDLFIAGGDVPGIQDLRLIIVESWALGDESGDRHRASRLLNLVARMLGTGVATPTFDDIAESLRAAWSPFLTDADLALGLEAIELLAANQPGPDEALQTFASAILSRIGVHNARRIGEVCLETARALAPEFGLDLAIPVPPEKTATEAGSRVHPPDGTFVAIYSLMEPAATRAAAILRRWYPHIRVDTLAGKVASDELRFAAKNSDVLVIADRAAAHSATEALKVARGGSPIYYASGKGTTSLIDAVLNGFSASFVGAPATAASAFGPVP